MAFRQFWDCIRSYETVYFNVSIFKQLVNDENIRKVHEIYLRFAIKAYRNQFLYYVPNWDEEDDS